MADAASPTTAGAAAARAAGGPRRASAKRRPPRSTGRSGRGGAARSPSAFRWARVLLLVFAVVVGLPLAHAMLGEVVALLGGAVLLGFLLGRWTAPS